MQCSGGYVSRLSEYGLLRGCVTEESGKPTASMITGNTFRYCRDDLFTLHWHTEASCHSSGISNTVEIVLLSNSLTH